MPRLLGVQRVGEHVAAGVAFDVPRGWHIYGRDAGAFGLPTRIRYMLPPGWQQGENVWPPPRRLLQQGKAAGYGYDADVVLPTLLLPPQGDAVASEAREAGARSGGLPRTLQAQVDWLSCADRCIPGHATLHWQASAPAAPGADILEAALRQAVADTSPPAAVPNGSASGPAAQRPVNAGPGALTALALAALGGMLLNLMPCVFPVLSMKVLAYAQAAAAGERRARRMQAWSYALGNVASFVALGGVLVVLRAAGHEVGWGFHLQAPGFVAAMALVLFAVSLVQTGLLPLGHQLASVGQTLAARSGPFGAFFSGALAVVVATPCSAPFMGVATGVALAAPGGWALALFASMGAGLALPYIVLCHLDAVARRLPRAGAWMVRLREATGLAMCGSVIWLTWVLGQQRGATAMGAEAVGCLALATAAWLWRHWPHASAVRALGWATAAGGVALALAAATWPLPKPDPSGEASDATGLLEAPAFDARSAPRWQPYSHKALQALRAAGRPVFVEITAAWCVTCKLNEALVFGDGRVRRAFAERGVARLRADLTRPDAAATQALRALSATGVPAYALFSGDALAPPMVLPTTLTPSRLVADLERLGH